MGGALVKQVKPAPAVVVTQVVGSIVFQHPPETGPTGPTDDTIFHWIKQSVLQQQYLGSGANTKRHFQPASWLSVIHWHKTAVPGTWCTLNLVFLCVRTSWFIPLYCLRPHFTSPSSTRVVLAQIRGHMDSRQALLPPPQYSSSCLTSFIAREKTSSALSFPIDSRLASRVEYLFVRFEWHKQAVLIVQHRSLYVLVRTAKHSL